MKVRIRFTFNRIIILNLKFGKIKDKVTDTLKIKSVSKFPLIYSHTHTGLMPP